MRKHGGLHAANSAPDNGLDITRDDLGLSEQEIEVANKMGIDLKKLAQDKRDRAEQDKAAALGNKLGAIPRDAFKPGSPYRIT
jgi:hypothetical protein